MTLAPSPEGPAELAEAEAEVKGEPVPKKNLLASWRETKALFPDLFKVDLFKKMNQVDLFSGEKNNSLASQALTNIIIGPQLTPHLQSIDVCQSRQSRNMLN